MKAFPIMFKHPTTGAIIENQGMELRDYFAAKAMQAMIAETSLTATPEEFAQRSYMVADAMIKQREVKNV